MKKIKNFSCWLKKWNPPLVLIYFIMFFFLLFFVFLDFRMDNDFWFLSNLGKYIVNNGFPTVEPFTIHSDLSFIAQQWLTDIIFYFVYDNFDVYGMYVLVLINSLLVMVFIYKLSMLISDNKVIFSFVVSVVVSFFMNFDFLTVTRPQIFDALFLLIELYLLELYIKKNNKLYLIGLPIISLLMINLHCSMWLMLFVFLVPYFVERFVKFKVCSREKYSLKPLVVVSIIMFLVGFINPYGIEAIKYVFTSYGVDSVNYVVGEMQPLIISNNVGKIIFLYIFVVFISYYINKNKKLKLRYLLLFLGTCYLAFSHYKGALFLFVGSILCVVYNYKDMFHNREFKLWYKDKRMNGFIVCSFVMFLGYYGYMVYDFDLKEDNKHFFVEFVDYLDENTSKDIKLYTGYTVGPYFEYNGYKCYLDTRAEVFLKVNNKKEDILDEYVGVQLGFIDYRDFLDKYKFDYMVVGNDDNLYQLLDYSDYEVVYEKYNEDEYINYRLYKIDN